MNQVSKASILSMEQISHSFDRSAVGGHFSAFLEVNRNTIPGQYFYESSRSALYAVLKAAGCQRVLIPSYVCEAVPSAVRSAGCDICFYSINSNLEPESNPELHKGDIVLLVDYFGLCRSQIENQLSCFPKNSVIVDCSQAYFQPPFECLATIYSPRKYLPVPDGGIVHTDLELVQLRSNDIQSIDRYRYLLERVVGEPEASRHLYLESEAQLSEPSLRGMSAFTRKLIETVDLNYIKLKRIGNWHFLADRLNQSNRLKIDLEQQVPLCYPFILDQNAGSLRDIFRRHRIFIPLYWPGIICSNPHEKRLRDQTLYLPIDHRYGEADMKRILDVLFNYLTIS